MEPVEARRIESQHLLARTSQVVLEPAIDIIEGSLEAKLPTIWKDGNGTARKKLGRGES